MAYNTSFSRGFAFVLGKTSNFQDLHTPFDFEVGVVHIGSLGLAMEANDHQRPPMWCGNCQRTGHYTSTCTHEAWKEGDLWPPVQPDSEEEGEAEEEDVEEEEEAEEQATEEEAEEEEEDDHDEEDEEEEDYDEEEEEEEDREEEGNRAKRRKA